MQWRRGEIEIAHFPKGTVTQIHDFSVILSMKKRLEEHSTSDLDLALAVKISLRTLEED